MRGRPLLLLAAGVAAAGAGLLTARGEDGTATAPMDGAALFRAKGCATCHVGPDAAASVGAGPELDDLAAVAATRIEGMAAEDYVRQSIVAPHSFRSPTVAGSPVSMPALPVAPDELDALVAYLLTDGPG